MERPAHLTIPQRRVSPRRIVAISGALLLEAAAMYWIATGLSFKPGRLFPHTVLVEFFKTERPEPKPVALPQLKLVKPPIPVVPPPEIQIQTPKPPPRIRVVARARPRPVMPAPVQIVSVPAPAPPKRRGITAPI